MCNTTAFEQKLQEITDYLEYVSTKTNQKMRYEPELYAAYAAHYNLKIAHVGSWFKTAEASFVSSLSPDLYLAKRYEVWDEEAIDYHYTKEVEAGTLYECANFWFKED